MTGAETELIFPPAAIRGLRDLRGPAWRDLVESASKADAAGQAAFVLMMARLCNCAACDADAFRALQGCPQCARLALGRFRGSDRDLLARHRAARKEIEQHLRARRGKRSEP